MNYKGTTKLETERLILRKFKITDAQDMFDNYASSDNVTKYMTWETHKNIDVTKEYLQSLTESYSDGKVFDWAIKLKSENKVIGSISAKNLNENISKIEIGYCIGEKWWNHGIVTEALKEIIRFLFEEVDVNRIEAYHDIRNPASGRVMQKSGMKFEGILRQAYPAKNGVADVCIYSILKSDTKEQCGDKIDSNVIIRNMTFSDIDTIYNNFKEQNWNKPKEQFEAYYEKQKSGKLAVIVANIQNDIAGYLTINPQAKVGPFANKDIPEISDLNVFMKYQKRGIANKLLDFAENLVAKNYSTICLGVGLHSGYGRAQRIYVKRGYIPDGTGAWYSDKKAEAYKPYPIDDDLVLYMSKKLK